MGWTTPQKSFFKAAKRGDAAALAAALRQGGLSAASADEKGNTALLWACRGGHAETISLLLAAKADPNAANRDGETPLMWACYYGQLRAVELLLAAGANPRLRAKNGWDARRSALEGSSALSRRAAELLALHEKRGRNIWKKTGPAEVRHDTCLSEGRIELTEIFDFAGKERLSILRLEDGRTSHSRENFSAVPRGLLRRAAEVLKEPPPAPPAAEGREGERAERPLFTYAIGFRPF
jgi:hypothetical protein